MKKIATLLMAATLTTGCNAQEKNKDDSSKDKNDAIAEVPKGEWKVTKEFDEAGNLIRYDSIYTWSSGDDLEKLSLLDRDSTLQSLRSKFYRNFSTFNEDGFEDLFAEDSLFTKRFFDDDFFDSQFGKEFMDLDRIRERMEAMQQEFLERYQQEFRKPEKEDSDG